MDIIENGYSRAIQLDAMSLAVLDANYVEAPMYVPHELLNKVGRSVVYISRIKVPKKFRKQGVGTKLMDALVKDLDFYREYACLYVSSYGKMTDGEIKSWFKRYGFIDVGRVMIRPPKGISF